MTTLIAAAVDKVKAASVSRVYKVGEVPASPAYPYATVAATFDSALAYTIDGDHGVGDYRITTQSVGSVYDAAAAVDDLARGALLDQRVTVDGRSYGPGRMQVGAALVRDPDGGSVITITSTYLFATEE